MKKVAIIQSSYIPWKGYFDLVRNADLFIFYDHVQYTKKDWRSRNQIKTPKGNKWLTIPCGQDTNRRVSDVMLVDHSWQFSHWDSIKQNYKYAKYYWKYKSFFEDIYLGHKWESLAVLNQYIIKFITSEYLNAKHILFEDSSNYNLINSKAEGVIEILDKCQADIYLCGPSAKNYLTEEHLEKSKARFVWMDYSDYPEYEQLYPPFTHFVSIIDLMFNVGPDFPYYMKELDNECNWINRVR